MMFPGMHNLALPPGQFGVFESFSGGFLRVSDMFAGGKPAARLRSQTDTLDMCTYTQSIANDSTRTPVNMSETLRNPPNDSKTPN